MYVKWKPISEMLKGFSTELSYLTFSQQVVKSLASLVAQLVKNLPATWESWVLSLGWEDPPEKGKATYSNILAWRIPWTVQPMGSQRVRQTE